MVDPIIATEIVGQVLKNPKEIGESGKLILDGAGNVITATGDAAGTVIDSAGNAVSTGAQGVGYGVGNAAEGIGNGVGTARKGTAEIELAKGKDHAPALPPGRCGAH